MVRHQSGRRRGLVKLGVGGTIVLLIMLILVVWNDDSSTTDVPADADGTAIDSPGTDAGGAPAPAVPTASTRPPPTDPASAERALRAEAEADRSAAEALVGRWVPQLSSKRVGLVAGGITYGYPEIYADFQNLKARYPDALLVWSGDFSSFRAGDFWVTVVSDGFATGENANAWCDGKGITAGDCYAKRLSHTGGYDENTLHRG